MNLLITGTTKLKGYPEFQLRIDNILKEIDPKKIIIVDAGSEYGTDALAREYAKKHNYPVRTFVADWEKEGNRAGILRNEKMVSYCTHAIIFLEKDQQEDIQLKMVRELCDEYNVKTIAIKVAIKDTHGKGQKENHQPS